MISKFLNTGIYYRNLGGLYFLKNEDYIHNSLPIFCTIPIKKDHVMTSR